MCGSQAQTVGYGAGRPKKGPQLPPVNYTKKDTAKIPLHGELNITVEYVVEADNSISGMKVAEIAGDTEDKAYVNECILRAFEDIRKQHPGGDMVQNNARTKMKQPVRIPPVYRY